MSRAGSLEQENKCERTKNRWWRYGLMGLRWCSYNRTEHFQVCMSGRVEKELMLQRKVLFSCSFIIMTQNCSWSRESNKYQPGLKQAKVQKWGGRRRYREGRDMVWFSFQKIKWDNLDYRGQNSWSEKKKSKKMFGCFLNYMRRYMRSWAVC